MTKYSVRPLILGLCSLALAAYVTPAPAMVGQSSSAIGLDLGSSVRAGSPGTQVSPTRMTHQAVDLRNPDQSTPAAVQPVRDGQADAHATGVVNAIDTTQHKINLTHAAIPEIGWPPMTMDFPVVPSVNLSAVKPGDHVNFTIAKGKGGMYEVQSVQPAGQR